MINGNDVKSSDFLRVLLALKNNINRDLNVAELAIVQKVEETISCSLLNNQTITIVCDKLQDITVQKNDVVLILFTNSDCRQNLRRYKSSLQVEKISTKDFHNINYGIIVGIVYRKEN